MSNHHSCNTCDSCSKTYLPPRVTLTDANEEDYSLIEQGLGPRLVLKTLVEGRNIDIVEGPTGSLTINATTNLEDVTLNDTGTGISLIDDGTGPFFIIKKLIPGNDINIAPVGTSGNLIINSLVDLEDVQLISTGAGQSLVSYGTGPNLVTKSLVGGTGISIANSPTGSLTINNTVDLQYVRLLSTGSGQSLVSYGTGPNLVTKSLIGGTGISIANSPTGSLTINNTVDLRNVLLLSTGTGETLVSNGTGPNLAVKNLIAGSRMSITPSANSLTLQSLSQINNLGAGAQLVTNGLGPIMNIKSLLGTNRIIIDGSNPNTITISQVDLEPLIVFNVLTGATGLDLNNNENIQILLSAGSTGFTWGSHVPNTNAITILQTGSYLIDFNFQTSLNSATVQFAVNVNNNTVNGAQTTMDYGAQYGVGQTGGPINAVNYRNLTLVENYTAGNILYFWMGSTNVDQSQATFNVGNISIKRLY